MTVAEIRPQPPIQPIQGLNILELQVNDVPESGTRVLSSR